MTIYALAYELDRALARASVSAVLRYPEGISIHLERAPFDELRILYHRREPELLCADGEIAPRELAFEDMGALNGRRISSVRSLGLERVLILGLAPGGEWGAGEELSLRIDLTPASKPLALYEGGTERTLATIGPRKARRASRAEDSLPEKPFSLLALPERPPEEILPGGSRGESSPAAPEHTRKWKSAKETAAILARSIAGIDPVLAGVLARETGGDIARLWPILLELAARLGAKTWGWHLYAFPEEGESGTLALYPFELPLAARGERRASYLDALASRAERIVIPSYAAHLKRAASGRIAKEIKRLERLSRNLADDLEDAGRSDEYRYFGNLLVTYRHLLAPGLKEIVVRDFSGERDVAIPLDPARSPERNIRFYFTKAKKGEKGALIIRTRKREIENEIARSRAQLERIARMNEPRDLIPLVPRERAAQPRREDIAAPKLFRRFALDEKHTVYVGRSDRENDILTHEFAAASDLWFHAQGAAGSHVILKGAHRSTPHSIIERAAGIAAYFSKARTSSTVPVIYAEKRHVRRPRKSKAGTALCSRGKTIFVKPDIPDEKK